MERHRRTYAKRAAVLLVTAMLLTSGGQAYAAVQETPITSGTSHVILYLNQTQAFVNGQEFTLEAPATVKGGKTFVPLKFLGDSFGIKVTWQKETNSTVVSAPGTEILIDLKNKQVWLNGLEHNFDDVVMIVNGKTMLKLSLVSDYLGATYTYNSALRRVDVLYVRKPAGVYDPVKDNSLPVAKFGLNKSTYRIGEPIKYINLSYDPDGDGIKLEWEGNEPAFFKAGTYPVTLTVVDKHGNRSHPYTRNIVVEDSVFLTRQEFPVYTTPAGGLISTDWSTLQRYYTNIPSMPKTITVDDSRTLLMSDSPETFKEVGILYEDTINGLGRLYADHFNGTGEKVGFAILATNESDMPVKVKTTNKGEVYPSIYANLIGSEATIDFLLNDELEETVEIPPGATYIYKQFPDFYPNQGVNLIYDVETDGPVKFTFAADKTVSPAMTALPKLPFSGHIRGTFQVAGFDWQLDLSKEAVREPMKLVLGEGVEDPFVKGYDPLRGEETFLKSNYGTVYRFHSENPGKMAIMLVSRAGTFKGPFKINGEIVKAPSGGTLTAFDGMVMLHRTKGTEKELVIEYSPPANSSFPINLIFYPLDERAE